MVKSSVLGIVMFALGAMLLFSGCAGKQVEGLEQVQVTLAELHAFVGADIDAAIARAGKAKDPGAPFRQRCYITLRKYLPNPNDPTATVQPPVGLVDAFELAAELSVQSQTAGPLLPPELEADCAYVIARIRNFALRNGAKFAPFPGVGEVGGILLR